MLLVTRNHGLLHFTLHTLHSLLTETIYVTFNFTELSFYIFASFHRIAFASCSVIGSSSCARYEDCNVTLFRKCMQLPRLSSIEENTANLNNNKKYLVYWTINAEYCKTVTLYTLTFKFAISQGKL